MTRAVTRRTFLAKVAAGGAAGVAAPLRWDRGRLARTQAAAVGMRVAGGTPAVPGVGAGGAKVVLLGTKGGPRVNRGRANPSNLVTAAGRSYVVDCGYGVIRQLVEAGVEAHEVRTILVTHNHSDHVLELGPLVYSAWAGGLREPVEVWGPPPISKIVAGFLDSLSYDIDIRMEDEGRPDLRKLVRVHEFEAPVSPSTVFEHDGLRVSAVRVRHPPITHAYAYRFDAPDRSIVLSGDTTYSPELIALASGADVLVHEVMHLGGVGRLLARVPNAATLRKHLIDSHTTTEQVGRVAVEARVKTLVLSHLVPGDDPSITDAMWTEDVRKNFQGEIIVGRDLMTI
jgi:ribonuclease BN (tRNA processing enzyme)